MLHVPGTGKAFNSEGVRPRMASAGTDAPAAYFSISLRSMVILLFSSHSMEVGEPEQTSRHGAAAVVRDCLATSFCERCSSMVKGIGPHFARKIVETFGERTLSVIDESPSFLSEVKGIGPRRIELIRESWHQQKAVRGIMVFLQSHGVGTARAVRIYKTYGEQSLEIVRSNPYRLAADVWGFGFETADALARRMGLDPNSVERARAALRWVLQERS